MAIIIKTSAPAELLAAIKKEIDEEKIETWSYDSDGDFTHTHQNSGNMTPGCVQRYMLVS